MNAAIKFEELTEDETTFVTGGLAPIVWFVGGLIARTYGAELVGAAAAGFAGGVVTGLLRG